MSADGRRANLRALLEQFGSVDADNILDFIEGSERCPRWATVTEDSCRDHFIAAYVTLKEACDGLADELGGEVAWVPKHIVDLDTGDRYWAQMDVKVTRGLLADV